jgi:hypothetical protein
MVTLVCDRNFECMEVFLFGFHFKQGLISVGEKTKFFSGVPWFFFGVNRHTAKKTF